MALGDLLQKGDPVGEVAYLPHTKALQTWCYTSQLEINVAKTTELIICTKQDVKVDPVSLEGQQAEIVKNFKYLCTVLDSQLSFSDNAECVFKRCSQRLSS